MESEIRKCFNCPEQVERNTENPRWHHVDSTYKYVCANPYLPMVGDHLFKAEPDEYSHHLGRAVIVSTQGMAYYGVLRALSPGALVIIPRDEVPVPVERPKVTNVREIPEPEKVGLRHDGVSTSQLYPQRGR